MIFESGKTLTFLFKNSFFGYPSIYYPRLVGIIKWGCVRPVKYDKEQEIQPKQPLLFPTTTMTMTASQCRTDAVPSTTKHEEEEPMMSEI